MTGAPRIERVQLNGADIEYDVRGSGAPVVFIHGSILSDGFLPVIEQPHPVSEPIRIGGAQQKIQVSLGNEALVRGGRRIVRQ